MNYRPPRFVWVPLPGRPRQPGRPGGRRHAAWPSPPRRHWQVV